MDLSIYKLLVSDTKAGQLSKVLNVLRVNQLSSANALNIIVCCCSACANGKNEFAAEDVISVLKICYKAIDTLSDDTLEKYLLSLYHIIKYFISQGNINAVIQMEFLLLPKYFKHLNGLPNRIVYRNCCGLIHNSISQLTKGSLKIGGEDFLKMCTLSIKMYFNVSPIDVLQRIVYEYFSCCAYHKIDADSQHKTYILVLRLMEQKKKHITWNGELYKSLFDVLGVVTKELFNGKHFSKICDLIYCTVHTMKANCVCDNIKNALSIINLISALINHEDTYITKNQLTNVLTVSIEQFNSLFKSYGTTSSITQSTCTFVYEVLANVTKMYKVFNTTFWNNVMDDDVQIILYKLISCIGQFVCRMKSKCPCGKCGREPNFVLAINYSILIAYSVQDYINKKSDLEMTHKLMNEVVKQLKQCCDFVSELKTRKCSHWTVMWKVVGSTVYNITVQLYKMKSKHYVTFNKLFLKYLIQLEGCNESVIRENIFKVSISCLIDAYINRKELGFALVMSALNIYLQPNVRENLFGKWAWIKSLFKDGTEVESSLQQLNLANVYEQYMSIVKDLYPQFKITDKDKIDLLQFELQQYQAIWPSKISIICALKEIYLLADATTATKTLIKVWDVPGIRKQLYDLLNDVLPKYEKEFLRGGDCITKESHICLACLYFFRYETSAENMRSENLKDMQEASKILNRKELSDEQQNPNDECDIVTLYESLKLDQHNLVMQFLHKSLDAFDKCIGSDLADLLQYMNVYNILKTIAFEYRLHCYTLEYFRACLLCLTIARITSNKLHIIESIAHIIEKSNVNSSSSKALMNQSEKEILLLCDDDSIQKWDTITQYYTNKGIAYYCNNDTTTALEVYKRARRVYEEHCSDSKNKQVLAIRLDYLQWQLLLLPCEYEIEGHYEDSLVKPLLILNAAHEYYLTEESNTPYFTSILFETHESVAHMYAWLRLPREARCYSKELTFLAQELLIPLQSVKFLGCLAQADLLSCRFDDCQVKIRGMCKILCISNYKNNKYLKPEDNCGKVKVLDSVETLSNEFQEMMLDLPFTTNQRLASSGSPVLEGEKFKLPSFINHDRDCRCFCCMSIDFQELVLIVMNLHGQLSAHQLNYRMSQDYYDGALHIYNHITTNEVKFRKKIFCLIQHDIFPNIQNFLMETYGTVLLNIGNYYMGTSKFNEINEKLIALLENQQYTNFHMYNEACLQLLNSMSRPQRKSIKVRCPSPEIDTKFERTPETKCSKVKLPVTISPRPESHTKVIRRIKFDLSENDETKNLEKCNEIVKSRLFDIAKSAKTPKTPAPALANVQIYTHSSVKPKRTKRALKSAFDCPPEQANDENKAPLDLPSTSGPASPSHIINLERNTKLLTEKLKKKAASKKPMQDIPSIVVTNDDSTDEKITGVDRKRNGAAAKKNFNNCTSSETRSNAKQETNEQDDGIKKRLRSKK